MAIQTYDVNVGSTYEFKMGDVIKLTLKDGYTFYSSVVPGVDDNFSTGPADPVQAAIADPSTGSLIVFGREYSGDNIYTNKFTPKYKITWNPVAIAAEGHNDGLDGLVDATKIQVVRNELISAKSKIVVTKERLAYYDQKIKAEIAKKGDIKQVKLGGNAPISPDSNGVLNLPDNLVEGFAGGDASFTYPMSLRYYYKNGTDANMRDTLVFGADSTDSTLFHIKQNTYNVDDSLDQGTGDYVLPTQTYVDNKAAELTGSKFQKVAAIPDAATATDGVIYLVPNSDSGNNVFDEYFRVNLGTDSEPNYTMEKVGSTAIDLSGYVEESDLVEITTEEIDGFFTPAVTP